MKTQSKKPAPYYTSPKWKDTLYRGLRRAAILESPSQPPLPSPSPPRAPLATPLFLLQAGCVSLMMKVPLRLLRVYSALYPLSTLKSAQTAGTSRFLLQAGCVSLMMKVPLRLLRVYSALYPLSTRKSAQTAGTSVVLCHVRPIFYVVRRNLNT